MSDDMYKYYTSIKASITGPEMKSIKPERFSIIEKMAYEDVKAGKKARSESAFESNAEYKSYLLNLVDFACKEKKGIVPALGDE